MGINLVNQKIWVGTIKRIKKQKESLKERKNYKNYEKKKEKKNLKRVLSVDILNIQDHVLANYVGRKDMSLKIVPK